jgi:beta-lactamase class D
MPLDKKEIYLWGTLLALVKEQLEAINKTATGSLGFWGKSRIQARNKEMEKFLKKLIEHKLSCYGDDVMDALLKDIEFIKQDNQIWGDVSTSELEYIRSVLGI